MSGRVANLFIWLKQEASADRWRVARRAVRDAINVVIVAAVGRGLEWVLDSLLGTAGDDDIIAKIKLWFPRVGLGGLLLYYVISVTSFVVFSFLEEWRSISKDR
jgi:hypothetical protein